MINRYYYVGFSYMMMRRYADAIKAFSHILVYVSRTKNFQKNAQFDSITKKNNQMYALITICVALCPTRLDDTIHATLREKYGDQFQRMQRGGLDTLPIFEHLFESACPKFISPIPPDFDKPENNIDPAKHHLQVFMSDVKNAMLGPTLKSFLKLYTTQDLHKLAGLIDLGPENLRTQLLVYKQRSRQTRWSEGGLLEGDTVNTSDLDFALEGVSFLDYAILLAETLSMAYSEVEANLGLLSGPDSHLGSQNGEKTRRLVPQESCQDLLDAQSKRRMDGLIEGERGIVGMGMSE